MSVNQKIKNAVQPIVPECVPGDYSGDKQEYCTFNYSEIPTLYSDDAPTFIRYLIQLHWFSPIRSNPIAKKKKLKSAIASADFTYPKVTDASDNLCNHLVFEFEYVEQLNELNI